MNRFAVISGCAGAGKNTRLAELGRRGCTIVEEPGRRIVEAGMHSNGTAFPWIGMAAF
jgi:predicted ATPase